MPPKRRHFAHSPVEQNRCAVAPSPPLATQFPGLIILLSNILIVSVLVGIFVICSPKLSTYDAIKKAHDRAHAAQGLQPQNNQKLGQYGSGLCAARWQKPGTHRL